MSTLSGGQVGLPWSDHCKIALKQLRASWLLGEESLRRLDF